jgi:hypothetical protein
VRAPLDGKTSETSTTTWGDGSRRRQEDDGDEGRIEEVLADDDGIRRPRRATSNWWRGAGCHANSKPPPPPRHSVAALATLHETHDLRSAPEVPARRHTGSRRSHWPPEEEAQVDPTFCIEPPESDRRRFTIDSLNRIAVINRDPNFYRKPPKSDRDY